VTRTKGETHLNRATLPGEYGRLAFAAEDIIFTISELRTENFCVPSHNLNAASLTPSRIHVIDSDSERTLIAREVPGSSSNLYSVSGSSTHSLVFELPGSPADMGTEITQSNIEIRRFVMNFRCYALGDAPDERTCKGHKSARAPHVQLIEPNTQ